MAVPFPLTLRAHVRGPLLDPRAAGRRIAAGGRAAEGSTLLDQDDARTETRQRSFDEVERPALTVDDRQRPHLQ
jgi:hypothetical protein